METGNGFCYRNCSKNDLEIAEGILGKIPVNINAYCVLLTVHLFNEAKKEFEKREKEEEEA